MNEGNALSSTLVGYPLKKFLKLDLLSFTLGAFIILTNKMHALQSI